ncbi:MAG: cob(I)yrinic acid a,c-diamide adenosyltransferase [Sedimentisphaerales bacterium]|nr:cob(I)yrinic acid a,c-diamide adenosyltransferase [Sedimentisphaerales bacterium]
MLSKGLIQVYTGPGKGKTTAALGLALRAAGQGNTVLFCQFLKPALLDLGERKALTSVAGITFRIVNAQWDMRRSLDDVQVTQQVRAEIREALAELKSAAAQRQYDLICLDEINFCLARGLAEMDDIKSLIQARDEHVELVLTGRDAPSELIKLADLVTEMMVRKHPYDNGTCARKGIEY